MSYLKRIFSWYILSVVLAWLLMLFPLPGIIQWAKPIWILLVVIYWDLVLPDYIGLINNWIVGLITDILLNTALGLHGLALIFVGYFVLKMGLRIRSYPIVQQTLYVLLFAALFQSLMISFYLWQGSLDWANWQELALTFLPVFTTALAWPVLVVGLEFLGCNYLRATYAAPHY